MTQKELQKLNRRELLELMLEQSKQIGIMLPMIEASARKILCGDSGARSGGFFAGQDRLGSDPVYLHLWRRKPPCAALQPTGWIKEKEKEKGIV